MKVDALLATLVSVPSVSRSESHAADVLAGALDAEGLTVCRAGANVWFEVGSGRPRLLLASHIDTVPACDGWTVDPHRGEWEDDRLVGLGANDAKGCVAAMAAAAVELRQDAARLDGTLVVAFTAEEEVGGGGIRATRPMLEPIDAAVVGEPTGLEICTAQRGMVVLRLTSRGRGGHVAHAVPGVNAIHAAAEDIVTLAALRLGSHPRLGETRAQVTQVGGGRARNQVPDACEFFVDFRTSPGLTAEAIVEQLQAAGIRSEVVVHSARYEPCETDESHPLVRAALAAAGRAQGTSSATTSDWVFLSDIPAVKAGPGDTSRSHGPDEYLTRLELADGVAFYRRLVPAALAALAAQKERG